MKKKTLPEKADDLSKARSVQSVALKALVHAHESGRRTKIVGPQLSSNDLLPLSSVEVKAMEKAKAKTRILRAINALREDRPVARGTALFIANALEEALSNPAKAAEAFSIELPRGRGTSHSDAMHRKLAVDVRILKQMGLALTSSSRDRGAYERVAERWSTSIDTVKRAWKEHRSQFDLTEALETVGWEIPPKS